MKRVVFLSDTHVGSNYAVFPPDFRNPETDAPVDPNKFQRILTEYWINFAENIKPDIIILMGDLVEGNQTRENFHTLTLQNIQHQAQAFIELMKYWKWGKLYVVRGTEYHVVTNGVHIEEWIAQQLGAVRSSKWGRQSQDNLILEVEDLTLHCAHHVGASTLPHYQFTPLVREAWICRMNYDVHGPIHIVVRGHTHYYRRADIGPDFTALTLPCWQLPTPYMKKRSASSFPNLGLVEIVIDRDKYNIVTHVIKDSRLMPHRVRSD